MASILIYKSACVLYNQLNVDIYGIDPILIWDTVKVNAACRTDTIQGVFSMEKRWLYVTSEELERLRDAVGGVCVIPMGAIEKHGLHLPLGADMIQANHVVNLAAELEPVCIFPGLPFGDISRGDPTTPTGTISIPMATNFLLLEQLCDQISRYGFQKILLVTGHGGNFAWLTAFLEQLGNKKKNYVVASTYVALKTNVIYNLAKFLEANGPGSIPELTAEDEALVLKFWREKIPSGHGCLGETALVMAAAPESVKLDRLGIESGKSRHASDKFAAAGIEIRDDGWYEDYPTNYAAEVDPVDANERIGKAAARFEAERIANAYKVFKEDENLLKWLFEKQKGWN